MSDIHLIMSLILSIKESLEEYEKEAKRQGREHPWCGYGELSIEDSRESIKRRILVAREELLKLSKSL